MNFSYKFQDIRIDPKLQQEINDLLQSILNPHATPTRIKNEYHPPKNESSSPDINNFHNTGNDQINTDNISINETIAKYSPQRPHDHQQSNKSAQKRLPIQLRKPSFDEHHGMCFL